MKIHIKKRNNFSICGNYFLSLLKLCFDRVTKSQNNKSLIRITDVEACLNYGVLCFKKVWKKLFASI